MRTATLSIYKFSELSDTAKEAAIEHARENNWFGNAWDDESRQSIQTFCEHFNITLKDWSVGAYSPIYYTHNAENKHFRGLKLRDISPDNCPTGYCLDFTLWGTFHQVFKKTGDAKLAFDAAIDEAFKDWRNDMESQLSNEYISEHLEINEYEFTEQGEFWK